MAAWIISALRTVLPHAGTIIEVARPMLTKRKAGSGDAGFATPGQHDADYRIIEQQIAELQAAAAQNDVHVRELAQQLQATLTALQEDAVQTERKSLGVIRMAVAAMAVSLASAVLSIVAIVLSG